MKTRRSQAALGLPALLAAAAVAAGGTAEAAEDEVVIALEPTYGLLAGGPVASGVGAGASAWVGVTDTFWLSASGAGTEHFGAGGARRGLYEVFGGLVAALDVLRTIPFAEVDAGIVGTGRNAVLTVRGGLGADYLWTPALSIGGVIRYRPLSSPVSSDGLLTIQARLALRFDL